MHNEQPSRTARKIAIAVISLGTIPETAAVLPKGIVRATEQLVKASGVLSPRMVRFARSSRAVAIYDAFDWMIPGLYRGLADRKSFFENQVRSGISAGCNQVLVLGAGYDTLGWRLAQEYPQIGFLEIDHPATARLKAKGIEAMGKPDNLYLVPADLNSQRLPEILENHPHWDTTAPTVILAEGLLMYLPEVSVRRLFNDTATASGTGSRIVFDYFGITPQGSLDIGRWPHLMRWLSRLSGEPWRWGADPGQLESLLQNTGWEFSPELIGPKKKISIERLGVAQK